MAEPSPRREPEEPYDKSRLVYELTTAVTQAPTLEGLYVSALDALQAAVRPGRAGFLVADPDGAMRFTAWRGLSESYRAETEGHSRWPPETVDPRPILIQDIDRDASLGALRDLLRRESIAALAFFPLCHGGRLVGELIAAYEAPHRFSSDEATLAETLARHIGFALAAKQAEAARDELLVRERAARARAEALATVGRELAQSLDVSVVSRRIVESVLELFNGQIAVLYGVDEARALRSLAVAGAGRPFFGPGATFPPGSGIVGLAVESRRPAVTDDALNDPRLRLPPEMRRGIEATGHRAACAAPLVIEGGVVGALAVGDRPGRVFSPDAIALLEAFADHAAMAVRNAGLYQEAQRQLRQTETLLAVSQSVSETLNLVERLRRVARELARALRADMGGAYLVEDGSLAPVAGYHVPAGLVDAFRRTRFPVEGHPFILEARDTRRPAWSCDAAHDPRLDRASVDRFPHRSILVVPMFSKEQFLGVVAAVWWQGSRVLHPDELRLAEAIGRQAALAVENARLYEETERRRAEAEVANRAKDQFLAMLGHELRNPLGAISNAVVVLDRIGAQNDRVAHMRQIIDRQVRHLGHLVDDLLEVSRVTTGKIALQRQPVDLRALADAVLAQLHFAGRTGGHRITLDGTRAPVEGDPSRLEQVMINILDNALKYTPAGGEIAVTVGREGDHAVFRVRDTGVGIPADVLPHIFELFIQGRQGLERAHGGLGLGLTLVKRLVELHGGTVAAASEGVGRGSEFVVRLPARTWAETPAVPPRLPSVPACRVLIIEDQADARAALRGVLEMDGHQVEEAADGVEGLERLFASRPDLAFVDLGLPRLDGYGLARAVRATPEGDKFFLVALTGYGQGEDRRRVVAAGFNGHLVKPVQYEQLVRTLADAVRVAAETATQAPEGRVPGGNPSG